MKTAMVGFFLPVILLVLSCPALCAQDTEPEPERLASLRSSWIAAKEREGRSIRESYLDRLIKMRKDLTRQEKLGLAILVDDEIKRITGPFTLEVEPPETFGRTSNSQLASARSHYSREISRMIREKDQIYLKALKKLRTQFSRDGALAGALAAGNEIAKIEGSDAEVAKEELPKTAKQLGDFLLYTEWELTAKDGRALGWLRYYDREWMQMPWNHCRWRVEGERSSRMIHKTGHWKHPVSHSEDMKSLEALIYGKELWIGKFVRRLTPEQAKEIEAGRNN